MKNYLFLLLIFLIVSCKKNEDQKAIYLGYDYFPVNVDRELFYDGDSTITDEFSQTTRTHHFQIKEVIDSTFLDNENRPTQRIERYVRDSSMAHWMNLAHNVQYVALDDSHYPRKWNQSLP